MSKTHGLWQFHRALAQRPESPAWWIDRASLSAAARVAESIIRPLGYSGPQHPFRRCDAIVRCAYRFIRRYRLRRNVETWVALCHRIGRRMGVGSASIDYAIKGLLFARDRATVALEEFHPPIAKYRQREVSERLERILHARALRIAGICWRCHGQSHPGCDLWDYEARMLGIEGVIHERRVSLCRICAMNFGRLLKKAREIEEAKKTINRTRRKLNETTEEHA